MKNKILILIGLALALATVAVAEPVKLTRNQASELYAALAQIEPGLSAANAVTAADNLNALRPHVEALDKGKVAAQRQLRALPKTADAESAALAITDQLEAKGEERVEVQLVRFELTPDEITQAKIRPLFLATLRQYLQPPKK